LLPDNWLR